MKKLNLCMAGVVCFYLVLLLAAGMLYKRQTDETGREYLVEINRIMRGMEEQGSFSMPDLREMKQIEVVSFLKIEDSKDLKSINTFFKHRNQYDTHIEPLTLGDEVYGYVRFDYRRVVEAGNVFWLMEGIIALSGIASILVLVYLKEKLIKPFLILRDMPYELSKGRLEGEVRENKDRFFGKFVWGISMLKDHLKTSQMQTLKLEKEKKMLLLSISHDIKTPLNSIKLYAKALKEGVYDTDEEQKKAAGQIENLSGEIDAFVREIVKTSSQEIIPIEVEASEFYIKDLVDMIRQYYEPKCKLIMTNFFIGAFENKLLRGNIDSSFEVVENIMENAFKYGDGKRIEISFYEEEGCLLMKIKNTGKPVKEEEMPHLFDSFFRGSNADEKEGNGLGLYICREIMRKMGGEIFAVREKDGMSLHLVF
ncbi:MAG: HAMP domain-containing histidine kinase [Lachnospiraceae bacterium]|nr:HAMP domain-containing histidine kinase [Lachnospiraceae bacterium]MDE6186052.1 HAMP domain-containing histidine kinase [Lachnospiraceae bacterium]